MWRFPAARLFALPAHGPERPQTQVQTRRWAHPKRSPEGTHSTRSPACTAARRSMRCVNKLAARRSTINAYATRSTPCRYPMTIRFHPNQFRGMIRLRTNLPHPMKIRCLITIRSERTSSPRAEMPALVAVQMRHVIRCATATGLNGCGMVLQPRSKFHHSMHDGRYA